ncbi:MAG: VacJ family lipoprotein [Alphaproteobacteria bacterium]|nr:VacJ family lipoprotein [Alphaproteobacteria bacterium]
MPTFIPRAALSRIAVSLVSLALVAGCAAPPPADDKEAVAEFEQLNDPLEPMNRAIFEFNQVVDKALLKPVAQGYRHVVPAFGRDRVRDFLNNLRSPIILANDLLQGQPDRAMQTAMRFAFNTGFGAAGLFDVAAPGGLPFHDEDFGQTFAVWGIGEGPYLVLPILGPSNPRDTVGLAAEWLVDPLNLHLDHVGQDWAIWTRAGMYGVDKRERYLDKLDEIERGSLDYYASLRSMYRQIRATEVKNGTVDLKTAPSREKR